MSSLDDRRRARLPVAVLRHRDFRLIWGGQFVSVLGTQMHAVALSWQVYEPTGSPIYLGILGLVRAVTIMAMSLVGGAQADARDRRQILLVTQAVLLLMRTRVAPPAVREAGLKSIVEGLRFIRTTPVIWGVMMTNVAANLLGALMGLAPVFASDILDAGPQGLGLLLSAPAAGAVLGAAVISVAPPVSRPGRLIIASAVGYGGFLALFGVAPSLVWALLALAGAGASDSISVAMRHAVRNLATPDELRGRVAASHSALAMGGPRLGEFQSGFTATVIGAREAMVVGGAGCMLAALFIAWTVPAVTRYRFADEPADADDGQVATR